MSSLRNTIVLSDFETMADIGIHDFEIGHPQRVLISVRISFEADSERFVEDDLGLTVDYDFLRSGIVKLLASRRFNTQEALAHEILGMIRHQPRVYAAQVTTKKPDVYPDCAYVGFELDWHCAS
jgi:7,8-dihydroneopterin aldolase/epimerase/oxygenase